MESNCFVCLQNSTPLLANVCNCTSFVHATCQKKLVRRTKAYRFQCAVCQTPYKNMKLVYLPDITFVHLIFYMVVLATIGAFLLSFVEFLKYLNDRSNDSTLMFVFSCATFVLHISIPLFFIQSFTLTFPFILSFEEERFICQNVVQHV